MDGYEEAIAALQRCIDGLHDQAMIAADAYWDFVNAAEDKMTGFEGKSTLQLTCMKKGNHLEIKWSAVEWYGPRGKRQRTLKSIPKNTIQFSYTHTSLKKHAKDWEWETVVETERKMQLIRKQAHHVVRAIMSLRNAKQVVRMNASRSD